MSQNRSFEFLNQLIIVILVILAGGLVPH